MTSRTMTVLSAFCFCLTPCVKAQPAIKAVVNAASYTASLAPGTWAAIFGEHLASGTTSASSVPLATELNGVSVLVNGIAAPLLYVSPTQVNALIPFEVASLAPLQQVTVPVTLKTQAGTSPAVNIRLSRNAPAIFTQNGTGAGNALAFDASFNPVSSFDGGPVVLYATGLGPTTPAASSASGGDPAEPFNRAQDIVTVLIGENPARILFAGLAPGFPGVYQINAVPQAPVSNRVYLAMYPQMSNIATLSVPTGLNVARVTGSLDGLYPASGTAAAAFGGKATSAPISFSAMLVAGTLDVSFDIVLGAKPFTIAAQIRDSSSVVASARAVIDINPADNTWQGSLPVPATPERQYDFSPTGVAVTDFLSGQPFVGNIVPASRLDPIAVSAVRALPLPNVQPPAHSPNATFFSSGTLPAGGHFSISPSVQTELANFGAFEFISHQPGVSQTVTFELFVDGSLIASKVVNYQE